MKKYLPVYLYGIFIVIEGAILLFSKYKPFDMLTVSLGSVSVLGAIFAFISAYSKEDKKIQFSYHFIHGLAMLVYGIIVLVFCYSVESLISITSFLFIFYSVSEIVFASWLFNLGLKVVYKIIIVRFILGIVVGIGTVIGMNYSTDTLAVFGILFLIVGANVMLYVPVIKGKEIYKTQFSS